MKRHSVMLKNSVNYITEIDSEKNGTISILTKDFQDINITLNNLFFWISTAQNTRNFLKKQKKRDTD